MRKEKFIVALVPSFNNEQFIEKNLSSICGQSYQNYEIIYVDDCSVDNTAVLARKLLKGNRSRLIQNERRLGAMENIYRVVSTLDPNAIVAIIDGDDWLAHSEVFNHINDVYSSRDVWLTYGNYVKYPSYTKGIEPHELAVASRQDPFQFKHLRTYLAGLFQKIRKEDLMIGGQFLPVASDMAAMFPMVEMAGERACFIEKILYIYNYANPISDGCINQEEMVRVVDYLRSLEPYEKIEAI